MVVYDDNVRGSCKGSHIVTDCWGNCKHTVQKAFLILAILPASTFANMGHATPPNGSHRILKHTTWHLSRYSPLSSCLTVSLHFCSTTTFCATDSCPAFYTRIFPLHFSNFESHFEVQNMLECQISTKALVSFSFSFITVLAYNFDKMRLLWRDKLPLLFIFLPSDPWRGVFCFSRVPGLEQEITDRKQWRFRKEEIANFSNRGVLLPVIRSDPAKLPVTFLTTSQMR